MEAQGPQGAKRQLCCVMALICAPDNATAHRAPAAMVLRLVLVPAVTLLLVVAWAVAPTVDAGGVVLLPPLVPALVLLVLVPAVVAGGVLVPELVPALVLLIVAMIVVVVVLAAAVVVEQVASSTTVHCRGVGTETCHFAASAKCMSNSFFEPSVGPL